MKTLENQKLEELKNRIDFFAGIKPETDDTILFEVHGDDWCLLGNDRRTNVINDPFFFSKLQVFGFPIHK